MMRTRGAMLAVSIPVVMLFTGLVVASREAKEELFQSLGNLAEVVHLIENQYVDELRPEVLSLALDAGIVESVDRWSAVLPASEVELFRSFVAAPPPYGLVLTTRLGSAAVRAALSGSPAAAAGLDRWEVVEQVDGVNTRGRPLWQIRLELKQHEQRGEQVVLTVLDGRVEERREVALDPAEWQAVVDVKEIGGGAVLIRVEALPAGSTERLREVVASDRDLVLDLRPLVWGLEDEAISVADLFVSEGTLGGWRGRRAGAQVFAATAEALVARPPIVLIDGNTEGPGEILAGALQRAGATLVGRRTVGHAPHMRLIRDNDVNLWLPVGLWLRADDSTINDNGIEPDEEVPEGDDEAGDPILDRALELLPRQLEQAA